MDIKDTGSIDTFETGARRDAHSGKGSFDTMPIEVLSRVFRCIDEIYLADLFEYLGLYQTTGDKKYIYRALKLFIDGNYMTIYDAMLDLSKHYEQGDAKYGKGNWQKGIPISRFFDSAVRHILKVYRGDMDESHTRAAMWNLFGLLWTLKHKPEMQDMTFYKVTE